MSLPAELIERTQQLNASLEKLRFAPPVTHVYNPLTYGWANHEAYLTQLPSPASGSFFWA